MKLLRILENIRRQNSLNWFQLTLVLLFFCALSFGQLGRIEWLGTFYIHDLFLVGWLLLSVTTWVPSLVTLWHKTNWKKWWLVPAFGGWVIVGMTISFVQTLDIVPWLYAGRLLTYCLFFFSLQQQFQKNPGVLRMLLVCSGIYMLAYGLAQYILIPDSRYWAAFGWDDHYFRLIGPLLDPNLSGMLYLLFAWMMYSLRAHLPKVLWIMTIGLFFLAILLTYSRATYLAAAISLIFFWLQSKQHLNIKTFFTMTAVLLVTTIIYIAAPKPGGEGVDLLRTASIYARAEATTRHLTVLEGSQWLTGSGFYSSLPGQYEFTHARVPDNLLVLLIASTGVIGTVLFALLTLQLKPWMKNWHPEVLAALVALIVHAQFNNSALEPFIFLSMGIALISQFSHDIIQKKH